MPTAGTTVKSISNRLRGLECAQVVQDQKNRLAVQFAGGTVLVIEATSMGLVAKVSSSVASTPRLPRPTTRQHEYLTFIGKYLSRFRRAPAESDIERHFLVSGPSVNQMMQTLEKSGFITRQRGVPRSAKLRPDLEAIYVNSSIT
jgi:LexA DNA binding domain